MTTYSTPQGPTTKDVVEGIVQTGHPVIVQVHGGPGVIIQKVAPALFLLSWKSGERGRVNRREVQTGNADLVLAEGERAAFSLAAGFAPGKANSRKLRTH